MKFLALAILAGATATAASVTPINKVLQMLDQMATKAVEEKKAEQVLFAEYSQFCQDTTAEKRHAIQVSSEEIEQAEAARLKATADAAQLGEEMKILSAEQGQWEADLEAAISLRKKEHSDFQKTHTDYDESIDALGRAIGVLKQQAHDRKQKSEGDGESFIQTNRGLLRSLISNESIPSQGRAAIAAYIQEPDFLNRSAPEASAYEFQSNGVVDMLKQLKTKFVDEQRVLEKEESQARHSSELIQQSLNDQISHAKDVFAEKEEFKGKLEAEAAEAAGERDASTQLKNEDTKYLNDLVAECKTRSETYEQRQKLRGDEVEAIKKAHSIISDKSVSGTAEKHDMRSSGSDDGESFLQLRGETKSSSSEHVRKQVIDILSKAAEKTNSKMLSMLAVSASGDPFVKVKDMIQELIVKLMEEANSEAEQEGWCDTELSTNKQLRGDKSAEADRLRSSVDKLTAEISQLSDDTTTLAKEIAELNQAMSSAQSDRTQESVNNKQTIAEAQEAQTAVSSALTVLKEYYAKASESQESLLQNDDIRERMGDAFSVNTTQDSTGVVGMLEVIQSDFARLETETSTNEAESKHSFERFMADSKEDVAVKTTELTHKNQKKDRKSTELISTKKDLNGTVDELEAAEQYFEELKPTCVNAGTSYEERVARRKEEIQSLQEALQILESQ